MRDLVLLVLVFFIPANVFARHGKIILNNGHTIVGDIAESEKGNIVVSITSGAVHFKKSEIRKIEYSKRNKNYNKDYPFYYAYYNFPENLISSSNKPDKYAALIKKFAKKYDLSSSLIRAVIQVESNFDPFGISSKGARGLMQLMPSTADSLGVNNIYNPIQNIDGGCKYLRAMMDEFDGNLKLALSAYNAGPNAVKKYENIPPYPETQAYVNKVIGLYNMYRKSEKKFYSYTDSKGVLHINDVDVNDKSQATEN
ncbi:MAG: lytic transglycosylase domain-containing protein [bacterium]